MHPQTPMVIELVREIVAQEIGEYKAPEELAAAIEKTFQRIYDVLFNIVGVAGFQALLARAVYLTKQEFGWIEVSVVEQTDKVITFKDLAESIQREGMALVNAGAMSLLTNLIGLLCKFIGEDLTLRLVRRIWAERSLQTPDIKESK